MTLKELFEKHSPDCIYIEEYVSDHVHAEHFCFGFKDGDKKVIYLCKDGSGPHTLIDSSQEAMLDKNNHEFLLCDDANNIDIKLRFIKKVAHRFQTQKELDDSNKNKTEVFSK